MKGITKTDDMEGITKKDDMEGNYKKDDTNRIITKKMLWGELQ